MFYKPQSVEQYSTNRCFVTRNSAEFKCNGEGGGMARWQCNMIELCQWPPTLAPAGTKHSSTTSSTSLISCQPLWQVVNLFVKMSASLSSCQPLRQVVNIFVKLSTSLSTVVQKSRLTFKGRMLWFFRHFIQTSTKECIFPKFPFPRFPSSPFLDCNI